MRGIQRPYVCYNSERKTTGISLGGGVLSDRNMSIFPKITLRLENYLKAGFLNKEVGQTSYIIFAKSHGEVEKSRNQMFTAFSSRLS